jgi:hypothetical protein
MRVYCNLILVKKIGYGKRCKKEADDKEGKKREAEKTEREELTDTQAIRRSLTKTSFHAQHLLEY